MKGDVEERDKVSERDGENEGEGGIKGERWKRQRAWRRGGRESVRATPGQSISACSSAGGR